MKKINIMVLCILLLFVFSNFTSAQLPDQEIEEDITIQREEPVIEKITFSGNENISEETIREVMQIEPGDELDEDLLRQDLQSIFDLDYFQRVAPDLREYEQGVELVINVIENPVLQEVNFIGETVYDKETLLDIMNIELGEVINMGQIGQGLRNIEDHMNQEGYLPVYGYSGSNHFIDFDNVEITRDGELTVPLSVGVLNELMLEGNTKTEDFVILREITLQQGEPIRIPELQENIRNLYMLEFFEEINPEPVQTETGSSDIDIVLNIKERQTGVLNVGGSWSSEEGWIGRINVREQNLLGYGQRISFLWEFGGVRDLSLEFQEPRFLGSHLSVGANIYDREKDHYSEEEEIAYRHERGGSLTLGHPITDIWDGSLRYRLFNSKEYTAEDDLISENRISSLTFNVSQDTRDHAFNPREGSLDDFSLEYAGPILGSDQEFTKLDADIRRYIPGFEEDQAWAVRTRAGTSNGILPSGQKFSLGGSETLRGFDFGEFRGEHLFLTNLEYRFLLEDNFTGVLFADTGYVWDYNEAINISDLRFAAGLGVRMDTPVGQLRFDFGWNDDFQGKPHFSIGQTF